MHVTNRSYRPDIDGLRALAVLAVIGFHAFPEYIRGGYVGVDVFFVISGYLITGNILRDVRARNFSFFEFYARRVRRIFPALVLVLTATIALAWLLLLPNEFKLLGRHIISGSLFSSNILLWHETGYFDVSSKLKPLLHLWSLSIEEQFYLFWPLLLAVAWRKESALKRRIASIGVISFAVCVLVLPRHPAAAFYSPISRIWELLAGALLAAVHDEDIERSRESEYLRAWTNNPTIAWVLACAGLVLIAAAIAIFDSTSHFPGARALLPVLGSVLVLAAGEGAWPNRLLLSQPGVRYIGLISYPLYLWHWPLLAFLNIVWAGRSQNSSAIPVVIVIFVSILAAAATYQFLELPFRKAEPRGALWGLLFGSACITLVGMFICVHPLPRLGAETIAAKIVAAKEDDVFPTDQTALNYVGSQRSGPAVLFIGDSHAQQYYEAVKLLGGGTAATPVAFSTRSGCPFLPRVNRISPGVDCPVAYRRNMQRARQGAFKRIVITGFWSGYIEGVNGVEKDPIDGLSTDGLTIDGVKRATQDELAGAFRELGRDLKMLEAQGKEIVLIGSTPDCKCADPSYLAANARVPLLRDKTFQPQFPAADFIKESSWSTSQLKRVARSAGAIFIDPVDYMCPEGVCKTIDEAGTPLYMDTHHVRGFAIARYFAFLPKLISIAHAAPDTPSATRKRSLAE